MKAVIFSLCLSISFLAAGQDVSLLSKAMQTRDASIIQPLLAGQIELCIGDDIHYHKPSELVLALQTFLDEEKVTHFSSKHRGGSSARDVDYYVGELSSASGVHRITFYFNHKDGRKLIDEIRIQR